MIDAATQEPPPEIVAPAPHQASFGRVVVRVPDGTGRVRVFVDGQLVAAKRARGQRVTVRLRLPRRDVTLRAVAIGRDGSRASTRPVGPVLGLRAGAFAGGRSWNDPELARRLRPVVRPFTGTAAYYVHDIRTGAGAAWNAAARFPAASTLKLALAVEALRILSGPPPAGSADDELFRRVLIHSSNRAANELAVRIAGSTSAASAGVNATMRRLGLMDTDMYGGYLLEEHERQPTIAIPLPRPRSRPPIPARVVTQPAFPRGKYTSAADLARLARAVHLAAGGRGPVISRLGGAVTPAESRYLLYLLAHSADPGGLREASRGATVAHKAGWIATARHDAGVVYTNRGPVVIAVMTYNGAGAGAASDQLAARLARVALRHLGSTSSA